MFVFSKNYSRLELLLRRQFIIKGCRDGTVLRALASHQWPGFESQIQRQMRAEFVGSLLCTERFSPGSPVCPLLKNQKFDLIVLIVNLIYSVPN